MEEDDFIEIDSPVLPFDTVQLGRIALTWFNTRVRTYKDNRFDHVRYTHDDGITYAFIPSLGLSDDLHEQNYPLDYRPVVDDGARGWYLGHVAMIFKEIEEILEEE